MLAASLACGKGTGPGSSPPPDSTTTDGGALADLDADGGTETGAPEEEGSGAPADGEPLDIDGVHLSLSPAGCQLVATWLDQRREHHFDFPGECHFAPDPQQRPAWVVPTDSGKAVIVMGSRPNEGGDCDTALQVLVVTEKGPALSSEIQRVASCSPGPWDEMMYHVMASRSVLLGAP
ncbi:MAG: hypothetical protein H6712_22740 [Myxococcales bacterium]|nr:hypothetical protein [Myxococcales bacterium]